MKDAQTGAVLICSLSETFFRVRYAVYTNRYTAFVEKMMMRACKGNYISLVFISKNKPYHLLSHWNESPCICTLLVIIVSQKKIPHFLIQVLLTANQTKPGT